MLTTPRPGDSGFEEIFKKQSMDEMTELLQPASLARGYKVGASPVPLLQHFCRRAHLMIRLIYVVTPLLHRSLTTSMPIPAGT